MASAAAALPSLADRLASVLPKNHNFTIYHISTPPTRSPALYAAPPNSKPERTYTESHFLSVAIKTPKEVLVLAIEVLIYTTKHLTTIFVSKADSTGYLHLSGIGKGYESPLRTISTTFLEFLVETRQRQGKKLVLSLFARASDQYLFPGSVENEKKHVSDDRQLIKWWCRVLDPVLRKYASAEVEQAEKNKEVASQAYLIVPGEDSITSYMPPAVRLDPQLRTRWKHGHPLREISRNPAAPPRCLIPHFPDDPKARFLDELDDELPDNSSQNVQDSPGKKGSGKWKSVRSLEQFWETMAFRQECSSGRLVGFIWVVFTPAQESSHHLEETQESQVSTFSGSSKLGTPPRLSPARRQPQVTPHRHSASCSHGTKKRKPLRGPIIPRTPKIKQSSSSSSNRRGVEDILDETPYYLWPTTSRGTLVFSDKDYKKATENLLSLQFKNLESSTVSTKSWVDEVRVLSGKTEIGSWGFEVTGTKEAEVAVTNDMNSSAVNTMMAVKKKKRKAEDILDHGNEAVPTTKDAVDNGVNTLGEGLVKKKKKVQPQHV